VTTKHDILDEVDDAMEDAVTDLRSRLETRLQEFAAAEREEAMEDHECDHGGYIPVSDHESEIEYVEEKAGTSRRLLAMLGVDEAEVEWLEGHCAEDVLRHTLKIPTFRAHVLQLAERILNEMDAEKAARA